MRQRARVHGGVLRGPEDRCGSGQRELPLRRRRARVSPRQLRRRGARLPRRLRRHGCRRACGAARGPASAGVVAGRAHRRDTIARGCTRLRRHVARRVRSAHAVRTGGRRPDLRLHRRHDGLAEGRHVAQRRSLRVALATRASGHRTARRRDRDPVGQASSNAAARVSAHARHRLVHHVVDPRRGRQGRTDRPTPTRSGRGLDRDRTPRRAGVHDCRRCIRAAAARRARRRT